MKSAQRLYKTSASVKIKNMNAPEEKDESTLSDKLSGLVQKTIGGLEEIGGILTADPITAAEGEYNVEAGSIREDLGEKLESSNSDNDDAEDEQ